MVLKHPLFHFLAFGAALVAYDAWRQSAPPPTSAPPLEIVVPADFLAATRAAIATREGRAATPAEIQAAVDDYVREEAFYRDALARRLDRGDTIVRRRLIQKMEFLTGDLATADEPTEAELEAWRAAHPERYERPDDYDFDQIFVRRSADGAQDAERAAAIGAALRRGEAPGGDAFVHGAEHRAATLARISARFGAEFARALVELAPGEWRGPVASTYGLHWVKVLRHRPARAPTLDEVRGIVRTDVIEARREAARRALQHDIVAQYRVRVEAEAGE